MIGLRKATAADLPQIVEMYLAVCRDVEQQQPNPCGWREDIYPTARVAEEALAQDTLYLWEDEAGQAVATTILNHEQPPEYRDADWEVPAADAELWVVHTFMVHPAHAGKGYGRALLQAAAEEAAKKGLRCLRLDTGEGNLPAQRLYQSLGYRLCGVVDLHLGYSAYRWFHCYELQVAPASISERTVPAPGCEGANV